MRALELTPTLRYEDASATRWEKMAVHETYRMLGREHEADLDREARKVHLAGAIRSARLPLPLPQLPAKISRRTWGALSSRLAALFR